MEVSQGGIGVMKIEKRDETEELENLPRVTKDKVFVKSEPELDIGIDFLESDVSSDEGDIPSKNCKKSNVKSVSTKIYHCNLCSYTTHGSNNYRRHVFRHSKLKPYVCSICPYKAAECSDLKRHMKNIHSNIKSFKCNLCSYKTNRKYSLNRHMLTHLGIKRHRMEKYIQKKFSCDLCDYKGWAQSDVNKHKRIHNKLFPCTLCSYKAATSQDLKHHLLTHTDEKPFECAHCRYTARRKNHLKIHMKVHDRVIYYCSVCSYRGYSRKRLKEHFNNKHKS